MSSINNSNAPKLLVFAGPNGSGKSTVTKALPIVGLYVNADDIKRTSGCSDLAAAQEAETIRNMLLSAQNIPADKIVSRYDRSLKNVAALVRIADHVKIVDNTGAVPDIICEVIGNSVSVHETVHWAKNDIFALLHEV